MMEDQYGKIKAISRKLKYLTDSIELRKRITAEELDDDILDESEYIKRLNNVIILQDIKIQNLEKMNDIFLDKFPILDDLEEEEWE